MKVKRWFVWLTTAAFLFILSNPVETTTPVSGTARVAAQSNEEMAAKAVRRLLWKIEHPEDTEIIKEPIRARLIARQSSAAVEEDKS